MDITTLANSPTLFLAIIGVGIAIVFYTNRNKKK
jgi:hypothetical protein